MNKLSKAILFISSFVPLYIFLIILNIDLEKIENSLALLFKKKFSFVVLWGLIKSFDLSDILITFLLVLIFVIILLLKLALNANEGYKEPIMITSIENNNIEIMNYFMVYIFAFTTSIFSDFERIKIQTIIVFIMLITFIGYFFIKINLIYINPTIYILFGYNIYKAKTENTEIIILTKLSSNKMKNLIGKIISLENISNGIYILRE
ncbi:MAG: hypothetical protein N2486_01890 [Caloramator sp.]|nr:hypothetical protein [Caloramator sp.]